jgi:hypothetical protein
MLYEQVLKKDEMYRSITKIKRTPADVYKISLRGTGGIPLVEVPEVIRKCKNLQYLDFDQTLIRSIPE